nr:reverse transcriptase domain-containing protein [Tanacetum cinerariifolium]
AFLCPKMVLYEEEKIESKCGFLLLDKLKTSEGWRTPYKRQNGARAYTNGPAGNGEARGRVYALGGGEANQDPNVVKSTFLLNNLYASILFDTGVDRSFVSTAFS